MVKLHFIVFLTKLMRTSTPLYLKEKRVFHDTVHDRAVRHHDRLTMPLHRTALFQRSFTYMAVSGYNSLSEDYKKCSIYTLRKKYRKQLLTEQVSILI